jgi:hypothetical protein
MYYHQTYIFKKIIKYYYFYFRLYLSVEINDIIVSLVIKLGLTRWVDPELE